MRIVKAEAADKRKITTFLAYFGWIGTAAIVGMRAMGSIPMQYGTTALLTVGIGVASSLALGRYRLGDTITATFHAGMKSAATLSANLFTDVCIVTLDSEGKIVSADRPDAIGWEKSAILDRDLQELLAPRSMGHRRIAPGVSFASPVQNQSGAVFDARITITELIRNEKGYDTFIAIIAPSVATNATYTLEEK